MHQSTAWPFHACACGRTGTEAQRTCRCRASECRPARQVFQPAILSPDAFTCTWLLLLSDHHDIEPHLSAYPAISFPCSKALVSVRFVTMTPPGMSSSHSIGHFGELSTTSLVTCSFQNILFQQALDHAMAEQKRSSAASLGSELLPATSSIANGNHNSTTLSSPTASSQATSPTTFHRESSQTWSDDYVGEKRQSDFIFPVNKLPKSRRKNPRKRKSDATEVRTARVDSVGAAISMGLTNPFKQRCRASSTRIPTLAEFAAAQTRRRSEGMDPLRTSQAQWRSSSSETDPREEPAGTRADEHIKCESPLQVPNDLEVSGRGVAISASAATDRYPTPFAEVSQPFDAATWGALQPFEMQDGATWARHTLSTLLAGTSSELPSVHRSDPLPSYRSPPQDNSFFCDSRCASIEHDRTIKKDGLS